MTDLADLADLVRRSREDLLDSGARGWENATLERFLEALAAVTEDRTSRGAPTWADLAEQGGHPYGAGTSMKPRAFA